MTETANTRADVRSRIIDGAAELLRVHGPAAVTTRGVAERAGVQAPTIYRLFGDKDGLLESVAEQVMATYVATKSATVRAATEADVDPMAELRQGWDSQIAFGLANPALFRLLSDPDRVRHSPAARSGRQVLESRVHRIALAGRLLVPEHRAVEMIQAAGIGAIQTLLATPDDQRDPTLADAMFDAVLRVAVDDTQHSDPTGPMSTVVAFRAITPELEALSAPERSLLEDWLARVMRSLR